MDAAKEYLDVWTFNSLSPHKHATSCPRVGKGARQRGPGKRVISCPRAPTQDKKAGCAGYDGHSAAPARKVAVAKMVTIIAEPWRGRCIRVLFSSSSSSPPGGGGGRTWFLSQFFFVPVLVCKLGIKPLPSKGQRRSRSAKSATRGHSDGVILLANCYYGKHDES